MKIKNANGEFIEIEIIRYFALNDEEYLIYSLNETDDAGYIKLYASKIIGSKACIIADNGEWDVIKQIIKDVVRCNRDGSNLSISDINESNLSDVVLQDTRVFKLQGNLVTLLSENKKVFSENDEIIEENVDYESLYNEELSKNNDLEEKIKELEIQINEYKEKIENIKKLLEE